MEIKNTNIKLKDGAHFIEFCVNKNLCGERFTVLTYRPKETIKKYLKTGFFIFGTGTSFKDGLFYSLTKSLKVRTRSQKKVVLANAMYFINKAVDESKLKTD